MINQLRTQVMEARISKLPRARKQELVLKSDQTQNLHVVYVMTHVGVSGGSKIIFEHANFMAKLGVDVTIISHFIKPTWFPIEVEYIKIPFHIELAHGIPFCDVIVATYWDLIQACVDTGIAPVVYFEQGDFHLFDYEKVGAGYKTFIHKMFELPEYIMTVSNRAAGFIKDIYGRDAVVFHNALNEYIFNSEGEKFTAERPYMLMVGSDHTKFKGIPEIIEANKITRKQGYDIDIIWISATQPTTHLQDVAQIFVNPPQELIGKLYKGAQLYVSGSHYEAFSLPGLEAMACACPVVTTANTGVQEYAIDGYNSLFAEIGNSTDLANQMIKVLASEQVKNDLIKNGLATAEKYKWSQIVPRILEYYKEIAKYKVKPRNQFTEFELGVSENNFKNKGDYNKFLNYLLNTDADFIKLPLEYPLIEGHIVARWELAARRKVKESGLEEYFYCKGLGFQENILPYQDAYDLYKQKIFDKALSLFINYLNLETDETYKLMYFRWALFCLIELEQDDKAFELLNDTLKVRNDNADLYYLLALVISFKGYRIEALADMANVIKLLGEAVSFPEFLVEVEDLVAKLIKE
ncbi:MAG: glycosyltransferase family 4 protein [Bacilli bacterium]|nr:glycosyltransferase family 4 protein [Bacilli bacterium]